MAYWAQKNAVRDALNLIEEDDDSGYTVFASWVPLSPFTYYKQEVNNTCTIACTRMAFRYVDGSTPSESTIKSTTGAPCSIDSAVKYFNNNTTSSFSYSARYRATKTTMKNDLYSTISNGAPPILGIHLTISDGWPFDLNVHAVAVYSIMSDKSEVALCDPWAGYIGQPDWRWYDKSADDLYSAYDAVNAGYMY